ncbi:MAG: lysozyme [Methanobrevibacter sp.]|jgi:lysozyme|nr:lysozyme [Candidatus Methanoflexus mossambicus]
METSEKGIKFLIKEEGKRNEAYLDIIGIPTIGCGFTYYYQTKNDFNKGIKTKVQLGMVMDDEQIETQLTYILKDFETALNKQPYANQLIQERYDACISLMFNIGITAFTTKTLNKSLKDFYAGGETTLKTIENNWLAWQNAGSKKGILLPRRKREFKLFILQEYV